MTSLQLRNRLRRYFVVATLPHDSELLLRLYLAGRETIASRDTRTRIRYMKLVAEGLATIREDGERRIIEITDKGRDVVREALHGPPRKSARH